MKPSVFYVNYSPDKTPAVLSDRKSPSLRNKSDSNINKYNNNKLSGFSDESMLASNTTTNNNGTSVSVQTHPLDNSSLAFSMESEMDKSVTSSSGELAKEPVLLSTNLVQRPWHIDSMSLQETCRYQARPVESETVQVLKIPPQDIANRVQECLTRELSVQTKFVDCLPPTQHGHHRIGRPIVKLGSLPTVSCQTMDLMNFQVTLFAFEDNCTHVEIRRLSGCALSFAWHRNILVQAILPGEARRKNSGEDFSNDGGDHLRMQTVPSSSIPPPSVESSVGIASSFMDSDMPLLGIGYLNFLALGHGDAVSRPHLSRNVSNMILSDKKMRQHLAQMLLRTRTKQQTLLLLSRVLSSTVPGDILKKSHVSDEECHAIHSWLKEDIITVLVKELKECSLSSVNRTYLVCKCLRLVFIKFSEVIADFIASNEYNIVQIIYMHVSRALGKGQKRHKLLEREAEQLRALLASHFVNEHSNKQ